MTSSETEEALQRFTLRALGWSRKKPLKRLMKKPVAAHHPAQAVCE
jgi:hypothetical protein